jgi:hypothetical protein
VGILGTFAAIFAMVAAFAAINAYFERHDRRH